MSMTEPDFRINLPTPPVPICDFCSGTPVRYSYPSRPHTSGTILAMGGKLPPLSLTFQDGDGAWAACDRCHSLIQRADRDALVKYSVQQMRRRGSGSVIPKAELTRVIRGIHDNFWKNREGAPAPVEVEQ